MTNPRNVMKAWLGKPWAGPLLALVAVYGLFAALHPETFAQAVNLETMARHTVIVAISAVGMTLVMVKGGIDLSIGSMVALTTVAVARALESGQSPFVAVLVGLIVGGLCGLTNGALVSWLRVTPFIVTLGTMSIFRGVALGLADEQKVDADAQGIDELMSVLPDDFSWLLLSPGVWVTVVVAFMAGGLLHYTRLGRHIVAIGSNERTAELCGVPVRRVTILVYGLAGVLGGLAGVMEFATLTVGDPTDSLGLELAVIAAVVIGGASLSGGQGSIAGAVIGALLMTVIRTGCIHVGLPNWVQFILTGTIIVVAVYLDVLRRRSTSSSSAG